MDYDEVLHSFELPKTPASTTDGNGYDSGDDVELRGVYTEDSQEPQTTTISIANNTVKPINVSQMIATPPQSPPNLMEMPPLRPAPGSMPLLSKLLANPNFSAPPGYVICVPCYLCKQPFNNIDRLKEHLAMHASMMHVNNARSQPQPQVEQTEPNRVPQEENILYSCEHCGKVMNSQYKLGYHLRNSHCDTDAQKKAQQESYNCQLCKKSYKRKSNMLLHMKLKHRVTTVSNILPPNESNITETSKSKRQIWSTNLLNAVAAAQYNPATESFEKYIGGMPTPRQQHHPGFQPQQKYPLRSPFFNPNLWLDASYI